MIHGIYRCIPHSIELEDSHADPVAVLLVDAQEQIVRMPIEVTKANALLSACVERENEISSLFSVISVLLEGEGGTEPSILVEILDDRIVARLRYYRGEEEFFFIIEPADAIALSFAGSLPIMITASAIQRLSRSSAHNRPLNASPGSTRKIIPFPDANTVRRRLLRRQAR
ncbi:MAG: hypothetical protein ACOCVC_00900 [Spirochaeta sp.]